MYNRFPRSRLPLGLSKSDLQEKLQTIKEKSLQKMKGKKHQTFLFMEKFLSSSG